MAECVSCTVSITQACGLDCFFCFNDKSRSHALEKDIALRLLQLSKVSKEKIVLTGGEPLCHPSLFSFLKIIRESGFREVIVQTNGVMLDGRMVSDLREAGVTSVLFSLHTSDEMRFDSITRTKGLFKTVLDNLGTCLKVFGNTSLSYVIHSRNHDMIDRDFRFFVAGFPSLQRFEIGYSYIFNPSRKFELPRFSLFEDKLSLGLRLLERRGKRIVIADCGLPLCYLAGFETHSSYGISVLEYGGPPEVGKSPKLLLEPCSKCSCFSSCPGVQKEYVDSHGIDELYPLFKNPFLGSSFRNKDMSS